MKFITGISYSRFGRTKRTCKRKAQTQTKILIPKMSMQGLANYNKQTGYVAGDVTLEYETKKCTYDRGRMFTVDAMDNIESAGVAFGRLSGDSCEHRLFLSLTLGGLHLMQDTHQQRRKLRLLLQMQKQVLQQSEKERRRSKTQKQSQRHAICISLISLRETLRTLIPQHLRKCLTDGLALFQCQRDASMTRLLLPLPVLVGMQQEAERRLTFDR